MPLFYIREQHNGDTTWTRLAARTLEDATAEALQAQAVREAKSTPFRIRAFREKWTACSRAWIVNGESTSQQKVRVNM